MNTFCEHHKNTIKFADRCFDRILLNGLIQPFSNPSASSANARFNREREAHPGAAAFCQCSQCLHSSVRNFIPPSEV